MCGACLFRTDPSCAQATPDNFKSELVSFQKVQRTTMLDHLDPVRAADCLFTGRWRVCPEHAADLCVYFVCTLSRTQWSAHVYMCARHMGLILLLLAYVVCHDAMCRETAPMASTRTRSPPQTTATSAVGRPRMPSLPGQKRLVWQNRCPRACDGGETVRDRWQCWYAVFGRHLEKCVYTCMYMYISVVCVRTHA